MYIWKNGELKKNIEEQKHAYTTDGIYASAMLEQHANNVIVAHLGGYPESGGSVIATGVRMSTFGQQHWQNCAVTILRGNKQWRRFILCELNSYENRKNEL